MSQFGNGWSTPPGYPQPPAGAPPAPPQQIGQGQWIIVCGPPPRVVPWGDPSAAGQVISPGVWNSQADAQAWLNANPDPCGAAPPTTPTPPTQPPNINNPPPGIGKPYWVICKKLIGQVVFSRTIVQGDSAQDVKSKFPDTVGVMGPFSTIEDATAWNDANGQRWCDKTVRKKCTVEPIMTCPDIPAGLATFGTPGTVEWCKAVDGMVKSLGDIGNLIFKFIDERLDSNLVLSNIDDYVDSGNAPSLLLPFIDLMRQIVCWIGPYIETLRTAISCLRKWVATMFPKCKTDALFGLLAIRHLLLTMDRLEWGSDAAVWIVATSGFTIDPLIHTVEYLIRYACPQELMSAAECQEAILYYQIDDDTANCILKANGFQRQQIEPLLMARGHKPDWRDVIQWLRRNNVDGKVQHEVLRTLGVYDPAYRDAMMQLYEELPTISDHLHWLQRNVFDKDYVRDFKLLDGFEDKFWPAFGPDLTVLGMKKEYAQRHYAAHWINPSFSQQFAMVQRLRPGRVPANLVFSRADLLRTMQEMDVGSFFRERLEAVSHPIPNLTQCLSLYQYGAIDKAELVEMLKDLGFDDYYANLQANGVEIKVRRLNASSGHGWTPTALASAYAVGQIDSNAVIAEMAFLGYSKDHSERLMRRAEIELKSAPIKRIQQSIIRSALTIQEKAYECGAIDEAAIRGVYQKAGIPDAIASIAISSVDSAIDVGICSKQIQAFKASLLKGKVTLDQLREIMVTAGIPLIRVAQYLKGWAVEFQVKAPAATASQILRWVGVGLLAPEVARVRLLNLGWTDPDLALSIAESLARLARLNATIQAQAARGQAQSAKAALRLAKETESAARQTRTMLRGIASISTLKKWFADDLIDAPTFIDYATARGYPAPDAERYLAEAEKAWAKAHKPPKAKATKGPTGNGQSSPPAAPPSGPTAP